MPIEMPRGLPFSVDTWTPSSMMKRHHFLTHAHKDHCYGIISHSSYPIYSTLLTKSLMLRYFPQLDECLFVGIEAGQSITVDDPDGSFIVTAYDANHCPGAVMFLFEGNFGNILHTGDCRLTPECLQKMPEKFIGRKGKMPSCQLDFVFLDCTFGKSLMKIPSRQSAIQQVINCIWKDPNTPLVYLTCDFLGQEEILIYVFQTFGSKIYVDKSSHNDFYQALQLIAPQILSDDPSSRFHLFEGFPKLYERAKRKILEARENMQPEPLIIRPSAQWYACEETELTVTEKKILEKSNIPVKDQFGVWHVCYSMHSSRQELEWALQLLAPKWVVSTTPECRAMELEYVKKHCFSTQVSDDRFWKLLDIDVKICQKANAPVESSNVSPVVVTDQEPELQKMLANPSPMCMRPPLTLFGRARFGYQSCMLNEEMEATFVKDGSSYAVNNGLEQELPVSDDHKVENQVKKPSVMEAKFVKDGSRYAVNNGLEQERPVSDDRKLINQVKKPTDSTIKVDAGETKSDIAVVRNPVSYSCTGSSIGFTDNLRKLYRSMNAPVPQPLPSLIALMKANKRAKRRV